MKLTSYKLIYLSTNTMVKVNKIFNLDYNVVQALQKFKSENPKENMSKLVNLFWTNFFELKNSEDGEYFGKLKQEIRTKLNKEIREEIKTSMTDEKKEAIMKSIILEEKENKEKEKENKDIEQEATEEFDEVVQDLK